MKAVLIVCLVIVCVKPRAQVSDNVLKNRIDSLVLAKMHESKAVGVAIGIVKDGRVYYNQGYGTKKLHTNNPVDSLTNFHLASVSKVFVATAIMQLVEQGKINLDGKLLDYIPVNKLKDERYKNITIRQMLTHTSGIPDIRFYNWYKPKNNSLALGNYARTAIRTSKLKFDPGAKQRYSNLAFEMLGHVIEIVTKKPFDVYEYDQVLTKAGLSQSNFDYHKIDPGRRSSPHIHVLGVRPSKIYPYNREHGPSSTLNSCTYDMCQWILEMLRIYEDSSYDGVIRHQTLMDMWSVKYKSEGDAVGLAWWLTHSPLGLVAMHDGQDIGYLSNLVIYPEHKMGVVVLINGSYPEGMIGTAHYIALLLGDKIRKIPAERLKPLEGEYLSKLPPGKWKIKFKVVEGELIGVDGRYNFKLIPLGDNKFINPDDGASFVFDARDTNATTMVAFGELSLKKVK